MNGLCCIYIVVEVVRSPEPARDASMAMEVTKTEMAVGNEWAYAAALLTTHSVRPPRLFPAKQKGSSSSATTPPTLNATASTVRDRHSYARRRRG